MSLQKDATKPEPIRSKATQRAICSHTLKQTTIHGWAWAKGCSFRLPFAQVRTLLVLLHVVRTPLDWASIDWWEGFGGFVLCCLLSRSLGRVKLFAGSTVRGGKKSSRIRVKSDEGWVRACAYTCVYICAWGGLVAWWIGTSLFHPQVWV